MTPKLIVTYFPFGGRAEPIRLAAAIGKVPFTNKVLTFSQFADVKSDLPLGQLPILELDYGDGKIDTITQSDSILKYFGKLTGLYPEDKMDALKVDSMLATMEDTTALLFVTINGAKKHLLSDTDWTEEEKLAIRQRWLEKWAPKHLGNIEKQLDRNGSGWIVGDSMTVADLKLFNLHSALSRGMIDGIPKNIFDAYPLLSKTADNVRTTAAVASWYEKYHAPYDTFDFVP